MGIGVLWVNSCSKTARFSFDAVWDLINPEVKWEDVFTQFDCQAIIRHPLNRLLFLNFYNRCKAHKMQSLFSSRRSTMAVADSGNTQSRLQDIIFLLQNKKESLAASRSRLSLTSKQIQEICSALYSSSSYSQHAESSSLHNLLSIVKAIKIIPEPASSSSLLSETINLAPFHQLTHLEVRNIPIVHLSHLSQLRSQLHHLVLYACLDSLDDALQGCGGDNCSETFLWSELHSLHVTRYV